MPTRFTELPVSAATAYAQLQTAALAVELARDVSHLHGSFSTKQVKGTRQWYFAFREADQRVRQIYVGPDNDDIRSLVEKARAAAPLERLKPLAKSALALGCTPAQRKHVGVIMRLNEFGFFRAGGVLIGTHAFLSYANQLGLRWNDSDQTADIDFAQAGSNISIALPANVKAQPHSALTAMEEGFLPLVQYRKNAEIQIDFLTPRVADNNDPIHIENLDVALQPLRFMEFSLEDVQQATLFDTTGRCVVVSLPAPQRYAVQKLLLIGERTGQFRAKMGKDLAQVASLLNYFIMADPDAIKEAWADALSRGPGWRKRAMQGRKALAEKVPELVKALLE
ncbi:GSU2403 family nucleotidyltransferase fold protein [Aquabacterium sp.]|uniref:GSU2403 family nucleotidyltransferase fold protein n=1 Tax=Aquabacterium sp. TaxID=1872578 RepID=UPI0019BF56E6|nr:GSU2403 family nucleotidyltransferase fold protein [Aquabacterium sp.]MBC7700269.1 nucleotidyltransferase domain-containing protein [Aquabacterium sp.]